MLMRCSVSEVADPEVILKAARCACHKSDSVRVRRNSGGIRGKRRWRSTPPTTSRRGRLVARLKM